MDDTEDVEGECASFQWEYLNEIKLSKMEVEKV